VVQVALDLDVGAFVPPLRASWDRVGQVIATDVDTASAVGRCSAAVADIEVMTGNELR